ARPGGSKTFAFRQPTAACQGHRRTSMYARLPIKANIPEYRLQHLARHLHQLGERALHEFVVELAARFGDEVVQRLEEYRRVDDGILRALGGDRFPPSLWA